MGRIREDGLRAEELARKIEAAYAACRKGLSFERFRFLYLVWRRPLRGGGEVHVHRRFFWPTWAVATPLRMGAGAIPRDGDATAARGVRHVPEGDPPTHRARHRVSLRALQAPASLRDHRSLGDEDRDGSGQRPRALGYLLETFEIDAPRELERLRERLTATYAILDPLLPAEGSSRHAGGSDSTSTPTKSKPW